MGDRALPSDAQSALARVHDLRAVLGWLRSQELLLATVRDEAIVALVAAGLSYEAVARESGVTRARIGQIVQGQRE